MNALFSPDYLAHLMNAIYYIVRDSDLRYFIYFVLCLRARCICYEFSFKYTNVYTRLEAFR